MNILSENSIKNFFSFSKQENQLNFLLQVLDFKPAIGKHSNDLYTATLSDSKHKFDRFLLYRKSGGDVNKYDLIKVKSLVKNTISGKVIFTVGQYEVIEGHDEQIGNPSAYQYEPEHVNLTQANETKKPENPENTNGKHFEFSSKTRNYHIPLSHLTTFTKDLCIHVRCSSKSEIRRFKNQRGNGCLFNFIVLDSNGDEMQITCFNKVAEKLNDLINEGSMYEIIGGYVKVKDKQYDHTNSDYCIILTEETKVTRLEDDGTIKEMSLDLINLGNLSKVKLNSFVDVIGYVQETSEVQTKRTKNGEILMRKIYLVDDSEYKVEMVLWKQVTEMEINVGDILLVKKGKVGDFSGRNISYVDDTRVLVNPSNYPIETRRLREFAANFSGEFKHHVKEQDPIESQRQYQDEIKYLKEVVEDNSEQAYKVKLIITSMNHNEKNYYAGCPDNKCKKKLVAETDGFSCVNCNKKFDRPQYYFTLSLRVKDCTMESWVDIFGQLGDKLLNVSAEEYKRIVEENDVERLREINQKVEFHSFYFLLKSRVQVYNNIQKRKINSIKIEPLSSIKQEAERMIKILSN